MTEQRDRIHDWPSEMRRPEGDEQPAPANPRHTGIERLTQDDLCGMLPTEIVTYVGVLADERDALLALVAEPRAAAPPSDLDAEAAAHQEHCRLPSCGLCSACLLPWPCLVRRLADAHARCTNLTNAEASRIFTEAREMREERDAALADCAELRAALEYIAHFDDDALRAAQTLHWDMRGKARCALAPTTGGAAGEGT